MLLQTTTSVLEETLRSFATGLIGALPILFTGVLYLLITVPAAYLALRLLRVALRRSLRTTEPVYRQFITRVVSVFLWFAVALGFLSIVGLEQLAASLGTATGFLALGVAYALSGMIADAVAGMYLLRDPDFNPGDEVVVGDMIGVVDSIELRKTRFSVEGDTVVRGNAEIEKRWTKRGTPGN